MRLAASDGVLVVRHAQRAGGEVLRGVRGTALATTAPAVSTFPDGLAECRASTRLALFADLVGFTAASEGRDAEETRELLSRYFDSARTIVERYGGTVEKFIGDAVMACTPVAQEDDAERLFEPRLTSPSRSRARSALSACRRPTGEAAVTIGAEGQGIGRGRPRQHRLPHPVGRGARDRARRRGHEARLRGRYRIRVGGGAHELKGKAEPVPLRRALRVTAGRAGALKSAGLEPPFVGRERNCAS